MEGLIGLLFWVAIITKIVKAVKGEQKDGGQRKSVQQRSYTQQRPMQSYTGQRPVQKTTQTQRDAYYYSQQKTTKERLQQKYAVTQKPEAKGDILSRAKGNVQENVPDKVVQQVHAEVCRDYRATGHDATDVKEHKEQSVWCDSVEESDIIKRVNDLIITGYSGDMEFDRDFVAEGVDMLNRFTV